MKKTLLIIALGAVAQIGYSQGQLNFGNQFGSTFITPIYGVNPNNALESLSGNSSLGRPAGTTVYAGPLLQGTGFTFALFAGPAGTTEAALQFVSSTTFRTSANPAATPAGLVTSTLINVPGVAPGSTAALQVRVWDNQGGTVTTWAQVLGNQSVARGTTSVFASGALGGPDPGGGPAILPPNMTGWSSFNIAQVPEPSVIALGALGLGALLLRRRKNS